MLVKMEIPIQDYEGTGTFHQELFFDVYYGSDLTKEKVIEEVKRLHERDSQYPEYTGDWLKVEETLNQEFEWKTVSEKGLVRTTSPFDHPELGHSQYVSWQVIEPIEVGNESNVELNAKYPEITKMKAAKPISQEIGSFLEWLNEQEISLCKHDRTIYIGELYSPIHDSIEKLLARYFEIDLDKLEKEKTDMLDRWREQQGL